MCPVLNDATVAVKHGTKNIVEVYHGPTRIWPPLRLAGSVEDLNLLLTGWVDTATNLPFSVWAAMQTNLPARVPASMKKMPTGTSVIHTPLVDGTVICGLVLDSDINQPLYLFVASGGRLWLIYTYPTFNDGSGAILQQSTFYKGFYSGTVFNTPEALAQVLRENGIAIFLSTMQWSAFPLYGSIASLHIPALPMPPGVTMRTDDYFGPTTP